MCSKQLYSFDGSGWRRICLSLLEETGVRGNEASLLGMPLIRRYG
jgi:hypothetical protein